MKRDCLNMSRARSKEKGKSNAFQPVWGLVSSLPANECPPGLTLFKVPVFYSTSYASWGHSQRWAAIPDRGFRGGEDVRQRKTSPWRSSSCVGWRGPVEVKIGVEGKEEEVPVYMVKIDDPYRLSLDYLKKSGPCLDFGNITMSIHGERMPLLGDSLSWWPYESECSHCNRRDPVEISRRTTVCVGGAELEAH